MLQQIHNGGHNSPSANCVVRCAVHGRAAELQLRSPLDEAGEQHYLDASLAYKRCVLNAIKYLAKFGFTEEQVYLLLSCCPCEGRISGIVDVPNAVATLAVPLAIFDRDVRPTGDALSNAAAGVSLMNTLGLTRNTTPSRESNPRKAPAPYDPKLALCMPCKETV